METVFLKKGEDRRLRVGHLWVFSNEIDTKRSPLPSFSPGQSVVVADSGGRPLGIGQGAAYNEIIEHNSGSFLRGGLCRPFVEGAARKSFLSALMLCRFVPSRVSQKNQR